MLTKKEVDIEKESRIYSDRMRSADRGGSLRSGNMEKKQTASPHLKNPKILYPWISRKTALHIREKLILITTI